MYLSSKPRKIETPVPLIFFFKRSFLIADHERANSRKKKCRKQRQIGRANVVNFVRTRELNYRRSNEEYVEYVSRIGRPV